MVGQQEKVKLDVAKAADLRPKQIAKFWNDWGTERPADSACLDELIQHHGFSEAGARDFLKVYDATISFARLSGSDKVAANQEENGGSEPPTMPQTGNEPKPQIIRPTYLPSDDSFGRASAENRREIITLDEGDVVLTFPANLSPASFEDLKDHLELFIKKMQRRAAMQSKNDEAAN